MCVTTVQIIDQKPDLNNLETQNNATPKKVSWAIKFGYIDLIMLALGLSAGIVYLIVRTSTGVTALDILVSQRKDEVKQNILWGVALIIAIAFLGIFTTFHVAVARELLATSPTHDVHSTLKLLSLCKTCDLLMLAVDLVAFVIGYPDTEICLLLLFFTGPLVVVLLSIVMAETSYQLGIVIKEEKMLLKDDYDKTDLALYEKYGLV